MERKAPRGLAAVASGTRKASRRSLPAGGFPLTLPIRRRSPTASCTQRKSRLVRRCDVPRRIRAGALSLFFFSSHFGLAGIRTRESKPGAASIGRQASTTARVGAGRRNGGAQHGISGVGGVCRLPLVRALADSPVPRPAGALVPACPARALGFAGFRPTTTACPTASARGSMDARQQPGERGRPCCVQTGEGGYAGQTRAHAGSGSQGSNDPLVATTPSPGGASQLSGSRNVLPRVAAS